MIEANTRAVPKADNGQSALFVGRYRVSELLGRGAMSQVRLAEDLELQRPVAIKFLSPSADLARFRREALAIALLAHPNVTRIYDYGEADGTPFIVLEYLAGGTLEQYLASAAPLPDDEALRLSTEIARGLEHAHAHGIVHRDLKPANILLDEGGHAKLADFGIARIASSDGTATEAGTILGTAAYISPEQVSGETVTAASDVYAFGVILYRMLTGRLPFESGDPLALLVQHRSEAPPPLSAYRRETPTALASTVEATLAKVPTLRPPDGAALVAWLGGLGGTEEGAQTVAFAPAAAQVVGASRRGRARALAAIALLVLALAGAALAVLANRPPEGSASSSTPAPFAGAHRGVAPRKGPKAKPTATEAAFAASPAKTAPERRKNHTRRPGPRPRAAVSRTSATQPASGPLAATPATDARTSVVGTTAPTTSQTTVPRTTTAAAVIAPTSTTTTPANIPATTTVQTSDSTPTTTTEPATSTSTPEETTSPPLTTATTATTDPTTTASTTSTTATESATGSTTTTAATGTDLTTMPTPTTTGP